MNHDRPDKPSCFFWGVGRKRKKGKKGGGGEKKRRGMFLSVYLLLAFAGGCPLFLPPFLFFRGGGRVW